MTKPPTATDSARAETGAISSLIDLALESLPAMQIGESGVFCWDREAGEEAPRGRSLRYTLMSLLGLAKARAHGYRVPIEPDAIHAALWAEVDSPELEPGDYGLYLWAEVRMGGARGPELVDRLTRSLAREGGLSARLGMELGWIITGLALHVAANGDAAKPLLGEAIDQLLGPNRGPSGLFRHHGTSGRRGRFPNFATEIYSVLALATVGRHGLDPRALPAAQVAADRLLALQLPDGGWPWIYDVETGSVVERYEVYSVHQDAMAPMALLELAEATGERRYVDAVAEGLRWIDGRNELGAQMRAPEHGLVYRSIRRRRPLDRLWLLANTASASTVRRSRAGRGRLVELNRTDRPYHFGWVLEAWCGRETALDPG